MEKLPETWYVTVTEENRDILSRWIFEDEINKLSVGSVTGIYENGKKNGIILIIQVGKMK